MLYNTRQISPIHTQATKQGKTPHVRLWDHFIGQCPDERETSGQPGSLKATQCKTKEQIKTKQKNTAVHQSTDEQPSGGSPSPPNRRSSPDAPRCRKRKRWCGWTVTSISRIITRKMSKRSKMRKPVWRRRIFRPPAEQAWNLPEWRTWRRPTCRQHGGVSPLRRPAFPEGRRGVRRYEESFSPAVWLPAGRSHKSGGAVKPDWLSPEGGILLMLRLLLGFFLE